MKTFFITLAGAFAALLLFFIGLPILVISLAASSMRPAAPPARAVLNLDLRDSLTDQDGGGPLALINGRGQSVMGIVQTLHRAESDGHVKALLIRLPEGGLPPAAADELRIAIKAFKATGKPVLAHSQGLYPSGSPTGTYMVGAASGELWMQPHASLQAAGMASEEIFLKRIFDRYLVRPDFEQRYEYKNAVNPYLYDDFTGPHREATLSWMGSIYGGQLTAASADRKNPGLKAVLEAGPMLAEDALAKGLIDKVGQVEDAQRSLLARAGEGAVLLDFDRYRNSDGPELTGKQNIALIQAEGEITTGTSGRDGFNTSKGIKSDDIAAAFDAAVKDKDVKAILFRLSSPGGSDTASEQIAAAVRRAKGAGKPVVVSMGEYGASGGYWVSAGASSIYALPATLTGSIGVFGGKFALGDALGKIGVDLRQISVGGDYASAFGAAQPFTPTQRAAFAGWMDRIYDGFIERVAEGRGLKPERVREIAKGRVWTGDQAKGLGLVNNTGGFYAAVAETKRLAGIPAAEEVRFKRLPAAKTPYQLLQQALGVSTDGVKVIAAASLVLGDKRAQGLIDALAESRLRSEGQGLALAPLH